MTFFSSHGFYFFIPVYERLNKDENVSTQKHIANKQNLETKIEKYNCVSEVFVILVEEGTVQGLF